MLCRVVILVDYMLCFACLVLFHLVCAVCRSVEADFTRCSGADHASDAGLLALSSIALVAEHLMVSYSRLSTGSMYRCVDRIAWVKCDLTCQLLHGSLQLLDMC